MTVGEIRYEITGDDQGLRTALRNTEAAASNAAQSVNSVAEAVNNTADNSALTQTAMSGIAAAASSAAAAANEAAGAVQNTAQSASVSQGAYEAALSSQQRLARQIQETENRLSALHASEADMAAAQQSGDISAAAYRRYQREVQQTSDRLAALNIQHNAVSSQIAQMNVNVSATTAAANNASAAVGRIGDSAGAATSSANGTARATRQIGTEAETSANRASSAFKKMGAAASKALSMAATASLAVTGAAATAVAALAKSAVDGYAEYEQLAGGTKLMFGDAYDFIAEKAKTAFKDVQMSQNEYLEQVNGFAVGLKTALGGDELAAAELADRIVRAEADVVAATGVTAENVQNAFNGIMKNNFSMLDNLKLGVSATKEGFQELIDSVNAYKAANGEATNYTIDNLADCQNALVDYIEIQGLSGYAQAEGADTLSGSMASMKAAWQNMLTGMADPTQDFDRLVSNLVDSVVTVSDNLMPRIMAVLPQMAAGVTQLAGDLLPLIPETLEQMLPGVLEGADKLISALLDALSSVADTAIPIVTENADGIIDTLLTGLADAVPNLISKAADLCTALISAVLDNADIITQGAVDIVVSLAEGIGNNLDELIPAAVNAVIKVTETLLDPENIDRLITAAEEIINSLAKGLADSIPALIMEAPKIVTELANALTSLNEMITEVGYTFATTFVTEFCTSMADELVHHDWASTAETMLNSLADALDNAQKKVMLDIDNMLGGNVYGGDIDNVSSLTGIFGAGSMRDGIDDTVQMIEDGQNAVAEAYDKGMQEINELFGNSVGDMTGEEWLKAEAERNANARAVLEREKERAKEWKQAQIAAGNEIASGNEEKADSVSQSALLTGDALKEAVTAIDNAYDLGKYSSEKAYWADRLDLLEANRNVEDQEWIKYYSQTKEHYEKAAENEVKEAQKAIKEQETALKNELEDKFRELETEQVRKDYDDSWLLEQKRAVIEALDHNTDLYKDNDLKLLKEQKSYDEKALKETETAAEKQRDALEKSFDSIVKSRDSLSDSLRIGTDIFNTTEETDKRTGEKKKSRGIDVSAFEKKLAAKKRLTEKIAELYEKDVPDSLISELLKQDPEDALAYANQLLKDPKKLSKIKSMFKEDEGVSDILANMVTENSEEFEKLGTDAGALFGESFMAAFRENWENAMGSVFGEEYIASAAVTVSSANSRAGKESTAPVSYGGNTQSESGGTGTKKAASGGGQVYKILDLNGSYVAKVVREENKRRNTVGGG